MTNKLKIQPISILGVEFNTLTLSGGTQFFSDDDITVQVRLTKESAPVEGEPTRPPIGSDGDEFKRSIALKRADLTDLSDDSVSKAVLAQLSEVVIA